MNIFWSLNTQHINLSNGSTIYLAYDGNNWQTTSDACAKLGSFYTMTIYYNGTLSNGTYIYSSAKGDNIMNNPTFAFYYNVPLGNVYINYNNTSAFTLTKGIYGQYYVTNLTDCITCNCTYYNLNISSTDIDRATGNTTPGWDGTVWIRYYDCITGSPVDSSYSSSGSYYHEICNNNLYGTPYLYYHQDDNIYLSRFSTATNTSVNCC